MSELSLTIYTVYVRNVQLYFGEGSCLYCITDVVNTASSW